MGISSREISWEEGKNILLEIRTEVFVKEQNVPFALENDGEDINCYHLLLKVDGKPVACARIVKDGHIGRVAVLKEYRSKGLGSHIMNLAEGIAKKYDLKTITLHAQCSVEGFYEKLGYLTEGQPFNEAGIQHILMKKQL